MPTLLTSKGQVTIPKRIRDELGLLPGAPVEFSVNASGEVVLHWPARAKAPAAHRRTASTPCAAGLTCDGALTN